MSPVVTAIVSVLFVLGSLSVLITAIAFFRLRDSLSRINAFGPATALGLPLLVMGAVIAWTASYGLDILLIVKGAFTFGALVMVSSVGTNVLARATYLSGAPLASDTYPNDLAGDSAEGEDTGEDTPGEH
ncbi:MAG: cation:proton antiporter [Arachnia sp.]